MLPQYTRKVLGEKHLACFFVDLAEVLDFSPILKAYTKECGQPAYHPVMMTLLLMYAYSRGVSSSREIERRCETDLGLRYVSGGEKPDHDTLCAFRVKHLEAFRALFVDTLRVAQEAGLKKVGHLSVDGTKVKAAASKHKAMSYGRMAEAVQKLDEQVQRLLEEAAALDEQEQARYGQGSRGDELPEELNNPATRAQKLKEARNRLEADKKVALAVEKEQRIEKILQAQRVRRAGGSRRGVSARVGLIVTGKCEHRGLAGSLQRSFPEARGCRPDPSAELSWNFGCGS